MATKVRLHIHDAAVRMTVAQEGEKAVRRAAGRVRDKAKVNITKAGLVDTGAMRQSITSRRLSVSPTGVWYEVGSDLKYALYHHEGTGPWIYPRRAKVLRFKGGSGAFVFAPRVRGVKSTPFLTDALRTLQVKDFLT